MLFNSYVFLFLFLPVALAGYYVVAGRYGAAAARLWLCASSLFFYGWWNPAFVPLLLASIVFNHTLSRWLSPADANNTRQNLLLTVAVSANVLLLFYYKYLFPLLGFLQLGTPHDSVMVPLGISFFTFTQIGYLVDCRDGNVGDRGLINYVLFVTFFPHLIAGPILHQRALVPQFARDDTYRFKARNMAIGLTLFGVGLAKKVLLADSIATSVDTAFAGASRLPLLPAWYAAVGYSMQLYFDFSGYSDMAVGLGAMFAIRLPLNFNSPYQSRSIIDYWQRWHITLTRYVMQLIYTPLALIAGRYRQRHGMPVDRRSTATLGGFLSMVVLPTFATVLIAGIWHGAGLTFVVFGLLHGCYLAINHAWRALRGRRSIAAGWSIPLTYLAVLAAQVIFRAPTLGAAFDVLAGMTGMHGLGSGGAPGLAACAGLTILLLIAFGLPNIYRVLGEESPALTAVRPLNRPAFTWRPSWQFAASAGLLLGLSLLALQRETAFLYFQF